MVIEDTSSNGVYLNGSDRALGRGTSSPLKHGDLLTIGDYVIQVSVVVPAVQQAGIQPAPPENDDFDPWGGNEPDFSTPADSVGDVGLPTESDDDWLSDMGDSGQSIQANNPTADLGISPSNSVDDDWLNFDDSASDSSAPAEQQPSSASVPSATDDEDPFAWLSGSADNAETDPLISSEEGTQLENMSPISGAGAVQIGGSAFEDDSQDPFADMVDPNPSSGAAMDDQETPTVRQPSSPVPPQRPIETPGRPAPQPPAVAQQPARAPQTPPQPASGSNTSGLDAVLRSAGLNAADFRNISEQEAMEQIGRLLHHTIEGIMLLLASRGEMKNAIRSDVTMLGRQNNNPLKFSVGTQDALTKLLLSSQNSGYMDADSAIGQAVDDLKAHQLAMLEAMRSAVRAMLSQFDPDELEQKLQKNNPLAANIPIKREAKLWQLFQEKFSDIQEQAVSDFGEMFGAEFRKAYEKRLSEMGRKPDF